MKIIYIDREKEIKQGQNVDKDKEIQKEIDYGF